jgi:hypothetical protein
MVVVVLQPREADSCAATLPRLNDSQMNWNLATGVSSMLSSNLFWKDIPRGMISLDSELFITSVDMILI